MKYEQPSPIHDAREPVMLVSINNPKFIRRAARFTKAMSSVQTIEKLIELVEGFLDEFVDSEYSGLYLVDPDQRRLRLYYAKGFNEEEFRGSR